MMQLVRRESYDPYLVGAGIGLVEVFAMATAKQPLGITSVFEEGAARVLRGVDPDGYEGYRHAGGDEPELGWESALVGGILVGSAASATLSGTRRRQEVPPRWSDTIGPSRARRYAAAFAGGALMMLGARMAKGCTSGHGISGSMQLAASSWAFSPLMFGAAALTAHALFGGKQRGGTS